MGEERLEETEERWGDLELMDRRRAERGGGVGGRERDVPAGVGEERLEEKEERRGDLELVDRRRTERGGGVGGREREEAAEV